MILTRPKMSYQQEKTKTFEIGSVLFVTGVDENKIGKLISEYKKRRMPLFWLTATKTNQFTMAFDCDESEAVMTEYLRILQVI